MDAAVELYNSMIQDGTWLGKNHKAKEAVFKAASIDASDGRKPGPCFNCGSTDHQIKDCPKPENLEKQKQMKKKWREEWRNNRGAGRGGRGRGGRGSEGGRGGRGRGGGRTQGGGRGGNTNAGGSTPTGKFCPPAQYENGIRYINLRGCGHVPHQWNEETRRWNPMANTAQQTQASSGAERSAGNQQTQTSASQPGTQTQGQGAAQTHANIANLQQQLNHTFSAMLNSVQE